MTIESKSDLEGMRSVGKLVARAILEMRGALEPGMTTEQLDDIGARFLRRHGARSAPQLTYSFPGFSCISVNDEVVHGVPGARKLEAGDLVKIDVTAELDGYIADSAYTAIIPPGTSAANNLVGCARAAFKSGVKVAEAGVRIAELGRAVEAEVNRWGHSVIREMCGHGVGRALHEEPSVPNFFSPFTAGTLEEGMVIALEPIIAQRPSLVYEAEDGWTIRTATGCLAAHYEHTIVIHRGAAEILTAA
ncbi:MAG TPA: type I methionyl aminopeptidase [Gemmatimonadaceae bacterium]|jgi:methionyl aminopeptidase|nr:type I methionyl aminopeptidase [Gemmatimonadaceae bacterium]